MHILLAGQAYYRQDNGQAVFTVRLAEGLAAAGHDVCVLAPSETGRSYRQTKNNVTIQTVPAVHLGHNANISAFSDNIVTHTIIEFNPDIIHIQDHYFLSRAVLKAAKKFHIPVVGTNHFLPDNLTDNFRIPDGLKRPVQNWMWGSMLSVFNQLEAATTPTETAVSILCQQDVRIPVTAISCGVDTTRFYHDPECDPAVMRRKYNLALDKPIFLYVGRVDREKNLDIIIKAMAQLDRQDVQFAIAGKGSHLKTLQTLAAGLGVDDGRVTFLGFVPDEDLAPLLNSVTYFTMPSHAELQSIATLEAMSTGRPVLAADARALPELVAHQQNGYLFTVGDVADACQGILYLIERQSERAEMQSVSLQKAEKHALHNTVHAYSQWYRHNAYKQEAHSRQYQNAR